MWNKYPDIKPDSEGVYRLIVFGTPTCGTCRPVKQVREARYRDGYFEFGEYDCSINVTHWMLFPEPPKEK